MSAFVAALPILGKALDKLFPDPAARDAAKLKLLELEQAGDMAELNAELQLALGQIATNTAEAQSAHWWVAGWRPGVGWVCVAALFWNFVLQPLLMWHGAFQEPAVTVPSLDISQLMVLLLGMLGIGGMRSFDKMKGTDLKGINR